jgi:hypothetical protein
MLSRICPFFIEFNSPKSTLPFGRSALSQRYFANFDSTQPSAVRAMVMACMQDLIRIESGYEALPDHSPAQYAAPYWRMADGSSLH